MKFKCVAGIEMSPMEKIVYNKLNAKGIVFYQEVTFPKCKNPKTGKLLRYDFYIPDKNLLIEYDGKQYHEDEETLYRDFVKTRFAKNNNITLIRLCGRKEITALMNNLPNNDRGVTVVKKKSKKKKPKITKPVPKETFASAIEKYIKGQQQPTKPNHQIREDKKKINAQKAKKKEERKTEWKPVPYKRIIIL